MVLRCFSNPFVNCNQAAKAGTPLAAIETWLNSRIYSFDEEHIMRKEFVLAVALALGSTFAVAGGETSPQAFWDKHSKEGIMSKEDALKYKGADGKSVDVSKADANGDGKLSAAEWTKYHQESGAAGRAGDATKDAPKPAAPAAGAPAPK
jgi:hypothetical protein